MPGMTETSLLPMAAARAGIDYDELTERILESALVRASKTPSTPSGEDIPFRKRSAKSGGCSAIAANQWKGPARCKWRISASRRVEETRRALPPGAAQSGMDCRCGRSALDRGDHALARDGPVFNAVLEIRDVLVEGVHQVTKPEVLERLA